jgi:hypothetical protein
MNITYLLGAGASANAIQPVNGMKESLAQTVQQLNNYIRPHVNDVAFQQFPSRLQENIGALQHIRDDFEWMLYEARYHETFDTLAKEFYLKSEIISLIRLKKALIFYFTIKQLCVLRANSLHNEPSSIDQIFDKRYDSLFAAIAKKDGSGIQLPANIKILTWNYDLQPELALKRYMPEKIHLLKERFQIHPHYNSFDRPSGGLVDPNSFGMVKLNGNAFWDNPDNTGEKHKETLFDKHYGTNQPLNVLADLAAHHQALSVNNEALMSQAAGYFNFAWENDKNFAQKHVGYINNIEEAEKIAAYTHVLVVIGYSFPNFNREIDKRLFEKMRNLKKIYIQDPNANKIKNIMENAFQLFQNGAGAIREVNFQLEAETNQFVIPYEL